MAFKLGMTVGMSYLVTLVLLNMTLMQGHSGSANAKQTFNVELSQQLFQQATSNKLATGAGHLLHDLD